MESIIKELWHGNIIPQEDSRTNSKEMKELLGYMARHHEDLEKTFSDEQKETFEKFHDCWSEYMSLAEKAIFTYAFRLASGRRSAARMRTLFCNCVAESGLEAALSVPKKKSQSEPQGYEVGYSPSAKIPTPCA